MKTTITLDTAIQGYSTAKKAQNSNCYWSLGVAHNDGPEIKVAIVSITFPNWYLIGGNDFYHATQEAFADRGIDAVERLAIAEALRYFSKNVDDFIKEINVWGDNDFAEGQEDARQAIRVALGVAHSGHPAMRYK